MNKIIIAFLIFSSIIFSQEKSHSLNDNLFSPPNIKLFADYLYCQKDYLRAADEYDRYLKNIHNDTVEFKAAFSYSLMNNFGEAEDRFKSIKESSTFYSSAREQYLKSIFQSGSVLQFRTAYNGLSKMESAKNSPGLTSLYMFSYLFTQEPLPAETEFIKTFAPNDEPRIEDFYKWKKDPPVKSPLKAAILSAIIPGAGKIYASETADGITAFIAAVGSAYLAYDNFNAGHKARGWIFSAIGAGFYAGNIYGSAAAVQIFNARILFDFINDLNSFLQDKNYFLKVFNFCN